MKNFSTGGCSDIATLLMPMTSIHFVSYLDLATERMQADEHLSIPVVALLDEMHA